MNKNSNISNELLLKWKNGDLSTTEKHVVDTYFKANPEWKEELESLTSEDLVRAQVITENVLDQKIFKNSRGLWLIGGAIGVAAMLSLYIVSGIPSETVIKESVETENTINGTESTHAEIEEVQFNIERVGEDIVVEEVFVSDEIETVNISHVHSQEEISEVPETQDEVIEDNLSESIVEEEKIQEEPTETVVISTKERVFDVQSGYIQTLEVEETYMEQFKVVGGTQTIVEPIKGYVYNSEGMPYFDHSKSVEEYIASELNTKVDLEKTKRSVDAVLSFEVNNKGKIKDIQIRKCSDRNIGLAILEVMEEMPDWTAGSEKGKKGRIHVVMSIHLDRK